MSRSAAIDRAQRHFDEGHFQQTLARRVAAPTESQNLERAEQLQAYLTQEMQPAFEAMGFACRLLQHPKAKAPFLWAERIEDPALPTALGYGHGDVIRGLDKEWREGLSPWSLTEQAGRWYGRGIADNKGQHSVNLQAMGLCAGRARALGLQRQIPDRDGRGNRLAGFARCVRRAPRFDAGRFAAARGAERHDRFVLGSGLGRCACAVTLKV